MMSIYLSNNVASSMSLLPNGILSWKLKLEFVLHDTLIAIHILCSCNYWNILISYIFSVFITCFNTKIYIVLQSLGPNLSSYVFGSTTSTGFGAYGANWVIFLGWCFMHNKHGLDPNSLSKSNSGQIQFWLTCWSLTAMTLAILVIYGFSGCFSRGDTRIIVCNVS